MKRQVILVATIVLAVLAALPPRTGVDAASVLFFDDFDDGIADEAQWGNEEGGWTVTNGRYHATGGENQYVRSTVRSLVLTDFSIELDWEQVLDGGVWLRYTDGVNGVLFVSNGTKMYWHKSYDRSFSEPLNVVDSPVAVGGSFHLRITVEESEYKAYIGDSPTPITTLTTNDFPSGTVGLYDNGAVPYGRQTFDNITVQSLQTEFQFDVNISAFIPGNHSEVVFPFADVQLRCLGHGRPRQLYVRTDDRLFDAHASSYRMRQMATLVPADEDEADGLRDGTYALLAQPTKIYASNALLDGIIDESDDDNVLGDCSLEHAVRTPLVNAERVNAIRIGLNSVRLRLEAHVGSGVGSVNGVGPGQTLDISWDFTIDIDVSGSVAFATIAGRHDGFPAYEVYVNGQEIYTFWPGDPPYGSQHLRRLGGSLEELVGPFTVELIPESDRFFQVR